MSSAPFSSDASPVAVVGGNPIRSGCDANPEAAPTLTDSAPERRANRRGSAFVSVAFTGLATQGITAVSGPLVARMLGPGGRGEMVLVSVLALMACQLGVGGLPMAIAHTVASAGRSARDVVRLKLRRWLALSLVPGVGVAVAAAILLRNSSQGSIAFAGVGFVLTTVLIWQLVLTGMIQGEADVRRINVYRLTGLSVYAGIVLVMFVFVRTDKPIVVLGAFIASIVVGLVVGVLLLRPATHDGPDVDTTDLGKFARRSYVSGVGLLDGLGLDLLLVGVLLGNAQLGLYAVALSATNVSQIVLVGVAGVLLPRLAAAPTGALAVATTRKWLLASVATSLVFVLALQAVVAPLVSFAFGAQFQPMIGCARILIVAWAFLGLRRVLTSVLQAQGRAGYASRIEVGCLALLLIGIAILAPAIGIDGAASSVLIGAVASCALLAAGIRWRADEPAAAPHRAVAALAETGA